MHLFLGILMVIAAAAAKVRYDGYEVWRLSPDNAKHNQLIRDLRGKLDFWSELEVMIPPSLQAVVKTSLRHATLDYQVIVENVQQDIDAEEEHLKKQPKGSKDLYTWKTYDEMVDIIHDMADDCPAGFTCSIDSLGKTHNGLDMPALWIQSGSGKPTVYMDSLIHSREWLAGTTTLLIADRLIYDHDDETVRIRETYNFYIAPVVNPDGYTYCWSDERMWRKNRAPNANSDCIGTDLNRNFAVRWGEIGSSNTTCSETFSGSSPASAPEVQNIQNKIDQLQSSNNLYAILSYHSFGKMWLHAYAHTVQPDDETCAVSSDIDKLEIVSSAVKTAIESMGDKPWKAGSVCTTIYPASGSSLDYAHDVTGCVFSFAPELRGPGFVPPPSVIPISFAEQWVGLVTMVDAIAALE